MNTAEKLIKLREEKGLTQYGLSRELNIAISSIKNYENVKKPRIPEAKLLLKIAKYYDVSMEYLLDDTVSNRKYETIDIEKKLQLDDETISSINDFISFGEIETFNNLVHNDIMYNLLPRIKVLKEINSFIAYVDYLLSIFVDEYSGDIKVELEFDDLNEDETKKYINDLKQKIITLNKCINFFSEKNFHFFGENKQYLIYNMFDLKGHVSSILSCLDDLKDLCDQYRENTKIKNKKGQHILKLDFSITNEYLNAIRGVFFCIAEYLKQIKTGLEAYKDIITYNLSDIFSDYLKYDLFGDKKTIDEILSEYNNIDNIKTSIISKDGIEDQKIITTDGDD